MSQPELRRRMRGSDAMFLYFERREMPLHIGSVAVLDGPFDEESERVLAARLPEIPRYRQRVMFSPFNLTHPAWEYDPAFDIRNHIRRVRLDPPGDENQLSELSGQVFTPLMDRNKPLWDLTIVDGLEGGRSALICRVHHSLVDGVSGIGLVNIMFDTTKEPRKSEPQPYNPPPLPETGQLLVEGLAGGWVDAAERLIGAQLTLLRMAQAFTGESSKNSLRGLLTTVPELLRPTERLPFNRPCSGVRGHCWTSTSFAEARAIRSAIGGTINDVVLTVVAGAVSRYVTAHREPVKDRFVRLLMPVNLRAEDPRGTVGNEISMLPLSLPLDIEDPAERLRVIAMRSAAMKSARIADVVQLIGTWIGWAPPTLQQSLAALPFLPQPVLIVNMVCTNVPGPMVPLYANGRELLTYYPHVPCGAEAGFGVAISSYNQNLYYGVTYDVQAAPDGELFRDFLIESYEELRECAGVRPMPAVRRAPVESKPAPAEDLRAHRAPATPAAPAAQEEPAAAKVPVEEAAPALAAMPEDAAIAVVEDAESATMETAVEPAAAEEPAPLPEVAERLAPEPPAAIEVAAEVAPPPEASEVEASAAPPAAEVAPELSPERLPPVASGPSSKRKGKSRKARKQGVAAAQAAETGRAEPSRSKPPTRKRVSAHVKTAGSH